MVATRSARTAKSELSPATKTPHGFVYAFLITVVIVAVTLFARSQSSPIIATPVAHAPAPVSDADKADGKATESKEASATQTEKPGTDGAASK